MSGSSPLRQAGRLWERTSGKGTRYMSGRLGGVKVVILPNRDYVEGDSVKRGLRWPRPILAAPGCQDQPCWGYGGS